MSDDAPSADGVSIPSSVDPDADPLGECAECGESSRRANSQGLCPDCAPEKPMDNCPLADGQTATPPEVQYCPFCGADAEDETGFNRCTACDGRFWVDT